MKRPIKPGLFAIILTLPLIGVEIGSLIRDGGNLAQHLAFYIVLDAAVFTVAYFLWSRARTSKNHHRP
ncbi:hypothetical protein [Arthrobacter sp. RAF14]|uniref:hypothetical protein n=1 Tax=Arthrobacter sp. RAF14 TaxID=3233051 RepID=UPI003F8D99D9